jgi:hypothetical protein
VVLQSHKQQTKHDSTEAEFGRQILGYADVGIGWHLGRSVAQTCSRWSVITTVDSLEKVGYISAIVF